VSDAAAVRVVAQILADYLPTELATRAAAEGLPTQTVSQVSTGRHIQDVMVGQIGVWVEDSETTEQHLGIDSWEYRQVRLVIEATVSTLDIGELDQIRSVWADAIRMVVARRFRVESDAGFYAILREETLDQSSSQRAKNGIRGALADVVARFKQPTLVDSIRLRITLAQRVQTQTDVE
jgi:uncharacterized protein (DUF2267 family)